MLTTLKRRYRKQPDLPRLREAVVECIHGDVYKLEDLMTAREFDVSVESSRGSMMG